MDQRIKPVLRQQDIDDLRVYVYMTSRGEDMGMWVERLRLLGLIEPDPASDTGYRLTPEGERVRDD